MATHLIHLDFITVRILREEDKLWSFSLCIHAPQSSSYLKLVKFEVFRAVEIRVCRRAVFKPIRYTRASLWDEFHLRNPQGLGLILLPVDYACRRCWRRSYRCLIICLVTSSKQNSWLIVQGTEGKTRSRHLEIWGRIQKFPDWTPGVRTTNGTSLYH